MSLGYNQITSAAQTGGGTSNTLSKLAAVQSRKKICPALGFDGWIGRQRSCHVTGQGEADNQGPR